MVKIAVVEDDERYIDTITEYLRRLMKEKGIAVEAEIFRDGQQLLFSYERNFDILLMDIEMPKMDGMTAAKKIREKDSEVILIFITSMAQYAIEGYKVRARSYLLKPINYISFSFEVMEAVNLLSKKDDVMLLQGKEGPAKISIGSICYIESQKHNLFVHTNKEVIQVRMPLKEIEEKLSGYPFERCNVSYLINLSYVAGIEKDMVVIEKEERIPISRQKRKSFVAALTEYIGEH